MNQSELREATERLLPEEAGEEVKKPLGKPERSVSLHMLLDL